MTLTNILQSDLVLRLSGGPRDGEMIPVATRKCYLGMETEEQAISDNPQCVIFRGPAGAVVRSYSKGVLFNGEPSSVHWLSQGDQITFPNSLTVQIEQLGSVEETEQESTEVASGTDTQFDARLDLIEAEIKDIQLRNDQTVSRFENIETRLDSITDQMTQLVNLSSSETATGANAAPQVLDTEPASCELLPAVEVEASTVAVTSAVEEPAIANEPVAVEEVKAEETPDSEVSEYSAGIDTEAQLTSHESVLQESVTQESVQEVEETFATLGSTESVDSRIEMNSEVITSEIEPTVKADPETASMEQTSDNEVFEYYSHTDDSDEQIMTFSSESEESDESEVIKNASNVEIKDAPVAIDAKEEIAAESQNGSESLESNPEAVDGLTPEEAEAKAAAEAQAKLDAEAETLARMAEMERIFGGSDGISSETETSDETPTEAEPTPESSMVSEPTQEAEPNLASERAALVSGLSSEQTTETETAPEPSANLTSEPEATSNETPEHPSTDFTSLYQSALGESQPADEQLSQAFDPTTYSQNEAVVPSAEIITPEPSPEIGESVSAAVETLSEPAEELSPLASQLLKEMQAESELGTESAEPQPVETPVAAQVTDREASNTVVMPPKGENESLADVLARMQAEGSWDGVPDEGESVEPIEPVEVVEPTPEPVPSSLDAETETENDVDDYMAQLLSRMRGDSPEEAAAAAAAPKVAAKKKEVKKEAKQKVEEFTKPENPLTPEEFKPKQKAKKIQSMDAMRELANSNTRSNIIVSEAQTKKELGYVQLGIAAGGILMSIYYFIWSSERFFDLSFLIGLTCIAASAFCLYRYYQAMLHNEGVDKLAKNDTGSTDQPATEVA